MSRGWDFQCSNLEAKNDGESDSESSFHNASLKGI